MAISDERDGWRAIQAAKNIRSGKVFESLTEPPKGDKVVRNSRKDRRHQDRSSSSSRSKRNSRNRKHHGQGSRKRSSSRASKSSRSSSSEHSRSKGIYLAARTLGDSGRRERKLEKVSGSKDTRMVGERGREEGERGPSGSEEGEVRVSVKKKSPKKANSRSSSHHHRRSDSRSRKHFISMKNIG